MLREFLADCPVHGRVTFVLDIQCDWYVCSLGWGHEDAAKWGECDSVVTSEEIGQTRESGQVQSVEAVMERP